MAASLSLYLNPDLNPYNLSSQVVVMKDKITQRPRGFGFVTFLLKEAAENAVSSPHTIDGRSVDAKPSIPHTQPQGPQPTQMNPNNEAGETRGRNPASRKLFIGGIPVELSGQELRSHFEQWGAVADSVIMIDQGTGRSRGFGFVTFFSSEIVDRVMAAGPHHTIGGKEVEVKSAIPRTPGSATFGQPSHSNPYQSSRSSSEFQGGENRPPPHMTPGGFERSMGQGQGVDPGAGGGGGGGGWGRVGARLGGG